MRTTLLFLTFLLSYHTQAQPFFSLAPQSHYSSSTKKIIKADTGKYFVVSTEGGTNTKYARTLYCIDTTGAILFTKPLFTQSTMSGFSINALTTTSDGNFICAGNGTFCDVGGDTTYIEKFDLQGNSIWEKAFGLTTQYESPTCIAELSNGNFIVGRYNNLLTIDHNGDSLQLVSSGTNPIRTITTSGNYFLVGAGTIIEKRDFSSALLATVFYYGTVNSLIIKNSNEYLFNSGTTIFRTDSLFTTIDSADFSGTLSNIHEIESDLTGFYITDKNKLLHTDFNFVQLNLLNSNNDFTFNDIGIDNNTLIITGEENSQNNLFQLVSSHPFIKSYSTSYLTSNETNDAEITDISSDSVNVILTPFTSYLHLNLYATVKNNGADTLNDVSLNFQVIPPAIMCDAYEISEQKSGLSITPNDTVTLYIGAYVFEKHLSPPAQFNICVWSSAPNHKIDNNHSNDYYCKSFNPNYITGVDENNPLNSIQISPNPAKDKLHITQLPMNKPVDYSISDVTGKILSTGILNAHQSNIELTNYVDGIYFITFEMEAKSVVRKFLCNSLN